jgi:hypothetical protein
VLRRCRSQPDERPRQAVQAGQLEDRREQRVGQGRAIALGGVVRRLQHRVRREQREIREHRLLAAGQCDRHHLLPLAGEHHRHRHAQLAVVAVAQQQLARPDPVSEGAAHGEGAGLAGTPREQRLVVERQGDARAFQGFVEPGLGVEPARLRQAPGAASQPAFPGVDRRGVRVDSGRLGRVAGHRLVKAPCGSRGSP